MKYAFVFGLLSVYVFAAAYLLGGWAWLLVWPAVSLLLVTAAYLGLGPRIFGKRPDGRLAWWAVALLLPFLLLTWTVWHLLRLFSREPACHEVAPRLWLGRRPLTAELPPDVDLVVDLTAEFMAPAAVVAGRSYLCVPVLDTLAPSEQQQRDVIEHTANWPGVVYVPLRQGHPRPLGAGRRCSAAAARPRRRRRPCRRAVAAGAAARRPPAAAAATAAPLRPDDQTVGTCSRKLTAKAPGAPRPEEKTNPMSPTLPRTRPLAQLSFPCLLLRPWRSWRLGG